MHLLKKQDKKESKVTVATLYVLCIWSVNTLAEVHQGYS